MLITNVIVDSVGVVFFKGPESYTGEDSFEVYAHGGLGVMSLIVDVFKGLGFDEAPPGEFTKRAFLNNKISLNEAEAVVDIIDSSSRESVYLSSKSLSDSPGNPVMMSVVMAGGKPGWPRACVMWSTMSR